MKLFKCIVVNQLKKILYLLLAKETSSQRSHALTATSITDLLARRLRSFRRFLSSLSLSLLSLSLSFSLPPFLLPCRLAGEYSTCPSTSGHGRFIFISSLPSPLTGAFYITPCMITTGYPTLVFCILHGIQCTNMNALI